MSSSKRFARSDRSGYKESLYTVEYRDIGPPVRRKTVPVSSRYEASPEKKKRIFYMEYFQSKIYQITHAFVQISFQCFSSRPKRFHPLGILLTLFWLESPEIWLLVVEDQSVSRVNGASWNAIRLSLSSRLNNDILCI